MSNVKCFWGLSFLVMGVAMVYAADKGVVCEAVANMWIEPYEQHPEQKHPLPFTCDNGDVNNLDTQLVYGEPVQIIDTSKEGDGWLKVESLQQVFCNKKTGQWQHVTGWIRADMVQRVDAYPAYNLVVAKQWGAVYKHEDLSDKDLFYLSMGTGLEGVACKNDIWTVKLVDGSDGFIRSSDVNNVAKEVNDIDLEALREVLIAQLKTFDGSPYCWGGACAWTGNMPKDVSVQLAQDLPINSVDCSGLFLRALQSMGFGFPRNSHDQYRVTKSIDPSDLRRGDLIFFKRPGSNFTRIVHIMMYLGKNDAGKEIVFEATATDMLARQLWNTHTITVEDRFGIKGLSFKNMKLDPETHGCRVQDTFEFCFSRIFDSPETVQRLRKAWFDAMVLFTPAP